MHRRPRGKKCSLEQLEQRCLLAGDFPAWNLAQFQTTRADSSDGGTSPSEATDGIVSNDSRWYSNPGSGGHWLEVELTEAYPVGSAQLFLGRDDSLTVGSFEIQFHNGSTWQTITSVVEQLGHRSQSRLPQSTIDTATRYRFLYRRERLRSVKEFVLLPPTDDPQLRIRSEPGVNVNLASDAGAARVVAAASGQVPGRGPSTATSATTRCWTPRTSSSGSHNDRVSYSRRLTVDLIGSLHIYSRPAG